MIRETQHVDARKLRDAFGTFPTGVTVITCLRRDGAAVGVTANSFVSLSLCPPLVSVALHQAARHLRAFMDSGTFAINVLRADQHYLSNVFARPSDCSWKDVHYHVSQSGHLILDGVAASFLCHLAAWHPVGDHMLLVGAIDHFAHNNKVEPLAFCHGRYGTFRLATHTPIPEPIDPLSSAIGWG